MLYVFSLNCELCFCLTCPFLLQVKQDATMQQTEEIYADQEDQAKITRP